MPVGSLNQWQIAAKIAKTAGVQVRPKNRPSSKMGAYSVMYSGLNSGMSIF